MKNLVVTVHDLIYLDYPAFAPALRHWQFRYLSAWSCRAARCIITDSEYSKSRIIHHFGIDEAKIALVHPGLSDDWIQPDSGAVEKAWQDICRRLPSRYVLSVGRMDPRKNTVISARIVKQLTDEGEVDGLVLVGPDDFGSNEIARQLEKERTDEYVTRLSNLSLHELQAVYQHASCLLYLSVAEGFGMPLIEAMAMGTPVVASNRTSIPEVCGKAALIVDPDQERPVIDAVRSAIRPGELHRKMQENGKIRLQFFTARRAADRLLNVYERVHHSNP